MPTDPAQLALALFEISLLVGGAALLLWLVFHPEARTRWFKTNALPPKPWPAADFALLAVLILLTGFAFQIATRLVFGLKTTGTADQQGLAIFVYSIASYVGALVAWRFLYPSLRRSWVVDPDQATAGPAVDTPPLPWARALRYAAATLAISLPLLSLVSLGWTALLELLKLPTDRQDVVAIFVNTRSPLVLVAMLAVACVLAPLYEELLFRAGLYRFCRQRLGRGAALVISGAAFGALHGYWLSFLPLALLGAFLALAYEATGSIRVPILAHALFNLNTVLVILSGLPELGS